MLEVIEKCSFTPCKPHLRHVTGEASRLREQMQAALPAPEGYAPPCQRGGFFADSRLARSSLVAFLNTLRADKGEPAVRGTLLAFDFGTKRIGVAVGNGISRTAQALTTLQGEQNAQRFAAIETLIREWQPAALVVGVPYNDDGTPHEMTRLCRRFANRLKGRFDLPVILVDERYTSAAASAQLSEAGIRGIRQKELLDQVSAQQILLAYFEEPAAGTGA